MSVDIEDRETRCAALEISAAQSKLEGLQGSYATLQAGVQQLTHDNDQLQSLLVC